MKHLSTKFVKCVNCDKTFELKGRTLRCPNCVEKWNYKKPEDKKFTWNVTFRITVYNNPTESVIPTYKTVQVRAEDAMRARIRAWDSNGRRDNTAIEKIEKCLEDID